MESFNVGILFWLVGTAALLGLLWLIFMRRSRTLAQKIGIKVAHSKSQTMTDIVVPDGIGGVLDIPRLVQIEQGIVVVDQLEAQGRVFGAAHIDLWTQILKGRSIKFDNPFYSLAVTQQVIESLVPGVPVYSLVVLGEEASFEKGTPEGATTLANLPQALKALPQQNLAIGLCEEAWQRIRRIARKDGKALSATK
jgi:hypothetical protein